MKNLSASFAADATLLARVHFLGNVDEAVRFLKIRPEGSIIYRHKNCSLVVAGGITVGYIFNGTYTPIDEFAKKRNNVLEKISKDLGVSL